MPHTLKRYELTTRTEPQALKMPKRARILHIALGTRGPVLCALVEEDDDTRAFDTGKHERHFAVASDGMVAPDGVYVGSVQSRGNEKQMNCYHVFEVRGRQPT